MQMRLPTNTGRQTISEDRLAFFQAYLNTKCPYVRYRHSNNLVRFRERSKFELKLQLH